ncbi:hypothetical protein FACS1894190_16960 [Spirochaetia bacterium]|nr:hypothetical protein FACS1894190_16960 [Spirochaetia bacterium]
MKKRSLNLLIVGVIYLVALVGVVVVSWASGIGVVFLDDYGEADPDTLIFLASVFFAFVVSFIVYLVYTLVQWHKADTDNNIKFLGVGVRILNAFLALVLSVAVLFLCVYFWVSDSGEEISLLMGNLTIAVVIVVLITVVNFVSFLIFKPRP